MAYIPKIHEKYDMLPHCRSKGGEVFSYNSSLEDEINQNTNDISIGLFLCYFPVLSCVGYARGSQTARDRPRAWRRGNGITVAIPTIEPSKKAGGARGPLLIFLHKTPSEIPFLSGVFGRLGDDGKGFANFRGKISEKF
jgi:hypothetical protein